MKRLTPELFTMDNGSTVRWINKKDPNSPSPDANLYCAADLLNYIGYAYPTSTLRKLRAACPDAFTDVLPHCFLSPVPPFPATEELMLTRKQLVPFLSAVEKRSTQRGTVPLDTRLSRIRGILNRIIALTAPAPSEPLPPSPEPTPERPQLNLSIASHLPPIAIVPPPPEELPEEEPIDASPPSPTPSTLEDRISIATHAGTLASIAFTNNCRLFGLQLLERAAQTLFQDPSLTLDTSDAVPMPKAKWLTTTQLATRLHSTIAAVAHAVTKLGLRGAGNGVPGLSFWESGYSRDGNCLVKIWRYHPSLESRLTPLLRPPTTTN